MNDLNRKYVDEMVTSNYNKLFSMMLSNLRNIKITEDLLQDAMVRIYELEDKQIKEAVKKNELENLIYNICFNYARKNTGNSYYYIKYYKYSQFNTDMSGVDFKEKEINKAFYKEEESVDYILKNTNQITQVQKKFFAVYERCNYNYAKMIKETGITFRICQENIRTCIDKLSLICQGKLPLNGEVPAKDIKTYRKKIHSKIEKNLINSKEQTN